ncbi:uncharacterized protein [Oscarella lobularis]|uniref:uncharacterized protein n=1 Tax=Oscarella lobularis TaxID=121494 RepID=UPI00331352EF
MATSDTPLCAEVDRFQDKVGDLETAADSLLELIPPRRYFKFFFQSCFGGSQAPRSCSNGTFNALTGQSIQCADFRCPEGQYTNTTGQKSCVSCEAGHDFQRRNESIFCPRGTSSLLGQGSCTSCNEGMLRGPSRGLCVLCPAGQTCVDPRIGVGIACGNGQYSLGNQSSCIDCPPGFQCVSPSSPPFECSPGFYSLGRATNCTEFLAGSACVSNAEAPTPCDPGHYSNAGMTACPS